MSIEFTKVARTLFRKSKKFRPLNDDGRLLYLYLLVNEHVNSAGCYQLSEGYALTDMKWESERFLIAMDTLCKADLVAWEREAETVLIEGWMVFNEPSNARHAMGIINQLLEVDDDALRTRRFNEVRDYIERKKLYNERGIGHELSTLINTFAYSSGTVSAPKNETEKEKENKNETENEREKETETREKPRTALRTVAAEGRDGLAPPEKGQGPPGSRLLETKLLRGTA